MLNKNFIFLIVNEIQFFFYKNIAAYNFKNFLKKWIVGWNFFDLFQYLKLFLRIQPFFIQILVLKWIQNKESFLNRTMLFWVSDLSFYLFLQFENYAFVFFWNFYCFWFCYHFSEVQKMAELFESCSFFHDKHIFSSLEGYDFLYWKFKQFFFFKKHNFRFFIQPTLNIHFFILSFFKEEWRFLRGKSTLTVILRLNPIIRKWAWVFFNAQFSIQFLRNLDQWMFLKSWRYAQRENINKSKNWIKQKYFNCLNYNTNFKTNFKELWIFADQNTGYFLVKFKWFCFKA